MDLKEKRVRELMADLNSFCLSHGIPGDDCKKCPLHKYEVCPLADFYNKRLLAIYNS